MSCCIYVLLGEVPAYIIVCLIKCVNYNFYFNPITIFCFKDSNMPVCVYMANDECQSGAK